MCFMCTYVLKFFRNNNSSAEELPSSADKAPAQEKQVADRAPAQEKQVADKAPAQEKWVVIVFKS